MARIDIKVAALAAMKPTALKAEWQRVHGAAPPRIATSLLARALAHDLQCAAAGGTGERIRQRLDNGCSLCPKRRARTRRYRHLSANSRIRIRN